MLRVLRFVVRAIVKFDRFVVKRYLNIETPLYKLWWSNHVVLIQKKLEDERDDYKSFTL